MADSECAVIDLYDYITALMKLFRHFYYVQIGKKCLILLRGGILKRSLSHFFLCCQYSLIYSVRWKIWSCLSNVTTFTSHLWNRNCFAAKCFNTFSQTTMDLFTNMSGRACEYEPLLQLGLNRMLRGIKCSK